MPCAPFHQRLLSRAMQSSAGKTVAVGISGGVDSSAAAALLLRQGYRVIGVHMTNWSHDIEDDHHCEGRRDAEIAADVCDRLQIPLHRVAFDRQYWTSVFSGFLGGLQRGKTPNPDVQCNVQIKFSLFRRHCLEELGADFAATGHYARLGSGPCLRRAADNSVDQTYFLCQVPGSAFRDVMFPVGELTKSETRLIAAEHDLPTASRKTSTGLCFVGKRKFPVFLRQFLSERPGRFIGSSGETLGYHDGQMFYTIGQRAKIGGLPQSYFVSGKAGDDVLVVPGRSHPSLFCRTFLCSNMNWVGGDLPSDIDTPDGFPCLLSIRYRSQLGRCRLRRLDPGSFEVEMIDLHRAATPGQIAAFYSEDGVCYGGADIESTGPSIEQLGLKLDPQGRDLILN